MPPPHLPKLPSPNLPTLGTKIKRVIARRIALFIMEDSNYSSLTFEKVTNPNIIEATTKSSRVKLTCWIKSDYITDYKPKIGVQSGKLTKLTSSISGIGVTKPTWQAPFHFSWTKMLPWPTYLTFCPHLVTCHTLGPIMVLAKQNNCMELICVLPTC